MIGAGGFIGSHLCEKLMNETPHKVFALDVYNDKIKHLLEPDTLPWAGRIQFHRLNIKHDSRLEGLIKIADLVSLCSLLKMQSFFVSDNFSVWDTIGLLCSLFQTINLAAICTPADYNTRPLDTIYSNFIDALPVVRVTFFLFTFSYCVCVCGSWNWGLEFWVQAKYCSENNKRLIHFSTCEVYGKTIGSFLPKDSALRQVTFHFPSTCYCRSVHNRRCFEIYTASMVYFFSNGGSFQWIVLSIFVCVFTVIHTMFR